MAFSFLLPISSFPSAIITLVSPNYDLSLARIWLFSPRNLPAFALRRNPLSPREGDLEYRIATKLLNNEKYNGDVLLQKTYVSDFFTGRQKENCGELAQYLIQGNHKAILPQRDM